MTVLTGLLIAFSLMTLTVVIGLVLFLRRRFAAGSKNPPARAGDESMLPPTAREET